MRIVSKFAISLIFDDLSSCQPLNPRRVANRRPSTTRRRMPRLRPSTGLARRHAAMNNGNLHHTQGTENENVLSPSDNWGMA